MISDMIKTSCIALVALLFFTSNLMGQKISKQFCNQTKKSIAEKMPPITIDRSDVYGSECNFEFTIQDTSVSLSIIIYKTEIESHESLQGWLYEIEGDPSCCGWKKELSFEKLDTGNSWDEVYFKRADTLNSGFVLLRKGKVVLQLLSHKDELLMQLEMYLRENLSHSLH